MKVYRMLLTLALVLTTEFTFSGEPKAPPAVRSAGSALDELDEVLVTGTQPGPALWQVKSGSHVVWMLAHPQLLPEKMKWRSKKVENVLAGAREVIVAFGGQNQEPRTSEEKKELKEAMASYNKGRYLPNRQTLRDILSPAYYARYEATTARFPASGKDSERLAPGHATNLLLNLATRKLKITHPWFSPVSMQVVNMAGRRNIKVTRVDSSVAVEDFRKYFGSALMETCPLENLLTQLDDGGAGWKALANAWSVGDTSKLRRLLPQYGRIVVNGPLPCKDEVEGRETTQRAQAANAQALQSWLATTERALTTNSSTLAVVDMWLLLEPGGLLEALRGRGYEVVES